MYKNKVKVNYLVTEDTAMTHQLINKVGVDYLTNQKVVVNCQKTENAAVTNGKASFNYFWSPKEC